MGAGIAGVHFFCPYNYVRKTADLRSSASYVKLNKKEAS